MIATRMLALPAFLLAPVGTPLDADVFDASHFPSVVFDVVAPHDFAAVDLTPAMLTIEEGTVQAVAKVDPATVAVSLVIDDSPTMSDQAVQDGQGASVELIRNVGPGARVSLSTPSGMLTALTTDQQASLARIAGIVAGSPDVMKLPDLVVDAAQRLAAAPVADRHLVVVLGSAFPDGPQLQALRNIIIPAGIRLDVVGASGLDTGPIAELATASGGISPVLPSPVGEMDAVTQAIRDRYHVTATVDGPGPHDVALNVGGQPFGATLDIPAVPAAAPATTPTPSTPTSAVPSGSIAPTATPTTLAATSPPAASAPSSGSSGMGRGARILIALLLLAVAIAAWTTWIVLRRRALAAAKRRKARAEARARADAEAVPNDVEPAAEVLEAAEPVVLPEPVAVVPVPDEAAWAEPVAAEPDPPEPEPEGGNAEVAVAGCDDEPEPDPAAVEDVAAVAAAAPPLSIRAARRARKKARRKLGQAAAAAAATEAVADDSPEPEIEPAGEPEHDAVETEPQPIALERQPEPVAIQPEPEPEPEPAAVELEPEFESVAIQPEPEPEPEPAAVELEPEFESVAIQPEPEPEPEPAAVELEPEFESMAIEPEPELEPEPAAVELEPEFESVAIETEPELEPELEPIVAEVEPESEPAEMEMAPESEPADEQPEQAEQPEQPEQAEQPAVAARRGRTLTERPRRQTNRRPAPEPPATPEPTPMVEQPPRPGRRVYPGDRTPAERTRRGSPADLPKRARSRRRFDNIPLIEPEAPSNGEPAGDETDWLTSGDLSVCRSTGQVIANGREVSLSASEFGALELLITSGDDGVARDVLQAAVGDQDPDVIVAQLRRKTGQRGRTPAMRRERVLRYFLADDAEQS